MRSQRHLREIRPPDSSGRIDRDGSLVPQGDSISRLLLRFDGADNQTTTEDSSIYKHPVHIRGTGKLTTADKKYGTAAFEPGTNGYVEVEHSNDLEVGIQPFTYEGWLKRKLNNQHAVLVGMGHANGSKLQLTVASNGSFNLYLPGRSTAIGTGALVNTGAWIHVALSRTDDNTIRIFVDGALSYTTPGASSKTPINASLLVGGFHNTSASHSATVGALYDNIRLTIGKALYTKAFTPPTSIE